MALPVGFDPGFVEEDEEETWETAAASVIATNWNVDALEPTAPQPEPYVPPAPAPAPSYAEQQFIAENTYLPDQWAPDISYVSNEDYFTEDVLNQAAPDAASFFDASGFEAGIGTGWLEDFDQQYEWWQAEVDKAIQSGDDTKLDALMEEGRLAQAWFAAIDEQQAGMDQYRSAYDDWHTGQMNLSAALTDDPRGEGGDYLYTAGWMDQMGSPLYTPPTGALFDGLLGGENLTDSARLETMLQNERMFRQGLLEPTAGMSGYLDQQAMQRDWLDQLLAGTLEPTAGMSGYLDQRYLPNPDFYGETDNYGQIIRDIGKSFQQIDQTRIGGAVFAVPKLAAKGTWDFLNDPLHGGVSGGVLPDWSIMDIATKPGEFTGKMASYTISGVKGVLDWATWATNSARVGMTSVPYVPYLRVPTFTLDAPDATPENIKARAEREYDELNGWQRFALEAVTDPWNYVGGALIKIGTAQKAWRFKNTTQHLVDQGLLDKALVDTYMLNNPSNVDVVKLSAAEDQVWQRLEQAGLAPQGAGIVHEAFAKRLVLEHTIEGMRTIREEGVTGAAAIREAVFERVAKDMVQHARAHYPSPQAKAFEEQVSAIGKRILDDLGAITDPKNRILALPARSANRAGGVYVVDENGAVVAQIGDDLVEARAGMTRNRAGQWVTRSEKLGEDLRVTQDRVAYNGVHNDGYRQADMFSDLNTPAAPQAPVMTPNGPQPPDLLTPGPVIEDLLPNPIPPRTIPDFAFPEASAAQIKVLNFMSQRDGVNYWDEIAAGGDGSFAAISNKIDEINARGLATIDQLNKLARMGRPADEIADLAYRPQRYVGDYIEELERGGRAIKPVDTNGFMTLDEFVTQHPEKYAVARDGTMRPLLTQLQLAQTRRVYGVDVLRDLAQRNMDYETFGHYISLDNLPPTPHQQRLIRALSERGLIPDSERVTFGKRFDLPTVNGETLTAARAQQLIEQYYPGMTDSVTIEARYGIRTPHEAGSADDLVAKQTAADVAQQREMAVEFVEGHVPLLTAPADSKLAQAGYRSSVKGATTPTGVERMTPLTFITLMHGNRAAFAGTAYQDIVNGIADVLPYFSVAKTKAGYPSSTTVSRTLEAWLAQLPDIIRKAPDDETVLFTRMLDDAYHVSAANREAGKQVTRQGADLERFTEAQDVARRNRPKMQAELERVTRLLNKHDVSGNDPKQAGSALTDRMLNELMARKVTLERQLDATNDLLNADPPTTRASRAAAKRAEAIEIVRATIDPTLPPEPPIGSLPDVAPVASTLDAAAKLVRHPETLTDTPLVVQGTSILPGPATMADMQAADDLLPEMRSRVDAFLKSLKGKQAAIMYRNGGTTSGMADTAFQKAGVTREEVESVLRSQQADEVRPTYRADAVPIADQQNGKYFIGQPFISDVGQPPAWSRPTQGDFTPDSQIVGRATDPIDGFNVTVRLGSVLQLEKMIDTGVVTHFSQLGDATTYNTVLPFLVRKWRFEGRTVPDEIIGIPISELPPVVIPSRAAIPGVQEKYFAVTWARSVANDPVVRYIPAHQRRDIVAAGFGDMRDGETPQQFAQRILAQHDTQQAGSADAAAGGLGIVARAHRRHIPNLIDPTYDSWKNADWSSIGKALDDWAKDFYNYENLLTADMTRVGRVNPAGLQRMAKVQVVGDVIASDIYRIMDGAAQAADPVEYLRGRIAQLADSQLDQISRDDLFYASSETGAQALRAWRKYGKAVLDDFDTFIGSRSMSEFFDGRIFERPRPNGTYSRKQMEKIDALIRGHIAAPTHVRPDARAHFDSFRQSHEAVWNTVRAQFMDGNRFRDGVTMRDIDAALFPNEPEMVDFQKMGDRIGSKVADLFATEIGYSPDEVPFQLRLMAWVKGQLSPIWMTILPGYHINNIAGNYAAMIIGSMQPKHGIGPMGAFPDVRRWAPVRNSKFQEALNRPGSGITYHAFRDAAQRTQFSEGYNLGGYGQKIERNRPALVKVKGKTIVPGIPTILDNVPVPVRAQEGQRSFAGVSVRGLTSFGEDVADKSETYFRDVIYSQEWMHAYTRMWQQRVDDLITSKQAPETARGELLSAIGVDQVAERAMRLGLTGDGQRAALAMQRQVIGESNQMAYLATKDMLRDYRMRNKIDGVLDTFMPVHFWATKNMWFVGKSMAQRPGVAIAGMKALDAWYESNEGLPQSLRTGHVRVPKELLNLIPGVDRNVDYHARVTNLINPFIFAVPKFGADMLRDYQKHDYSEMSIVDHLKFWGQDGAKNFWASAGYRIGPQWDALIKGANIVDTQRGGAQNEWVKKLNFIASPFLDDRDGTLSPGRQPFLPFGGLQSFIVRGENRITGENYLQRAYEHAAQFTYGSSYTNYENYLFTQAITHKVVSNQWTEADARVAMEALARGEYNDPKLRGIIDQVFMGRSNSYLVARVLAFPGREITEEAAIVYQANNEYRQFREEHGDKRARNFLYHNLPAPLQWLYDEKDAGRVTQEQIDAAIADAHAGKDNPLFQKAVTQSNTDEFSVQQQVRLVDDMLKWNEEWAKYAKEYGSAAAADKFLGTYNSATGKREGGEAPWLGLYWLGWKDDETLPSGRVLTPEENILYHYLEQDVRENAAVLRERYYTGQMEDRHQARPFFERMERNDQILADVAARAQAGHATMYQLDIAYKLHAQELERIYADAEAAGVNLSGRNTLPREGSNFYNRTEADKHFLEDNLNIGGVFEYDAQDDAVRRLERRQAQNGKLLDWLAETNAPKLWIDGNPNPEYQKPKLDREGNEILSRKDGSVLMEFDMEKYERDLRAVAETIPAQYTNLVVQLQIDGMTQVPHGMDGRGVTPEDFIHHVMSKTRIPEDLAAWRKQRGVDIDAYYAMLADPDIPREQKDARKAELEAEYGREVFSKTYYDTPDGTTASEHAGYDMALDNMRDLYYTLTPREKAEFEEQYPDAFVEVEKTGKNGKTYTDTAFEPSQMTYEQLVQALTDRGQPIVGDAFDLSEGPGGVGDIAAQTEAERIAQTDHIYDLKAQYAAVPDETEQRALDTYFTITADPLFQEAQALRAESPNYYGNTTWNQTKKNARAQGRDDLVDVIDAYLSALDEVVPVWDKQEAWFNALPEADRQLLLDEDPTFLKRYGEDGNPVTPTPPPSNAPDSPSPNPGPDRPSDTGRPDPATSSGNNTRTSGDSVPVRSSGGSASTGNASTPPQTLSLFRAIDPIINSRSDDGRTAIATEVAAFIDTLLLRISFGGSRSPSKINSYRNLFLSWVKQQLGDTPTVERWQQILDALQRRGEPRMAQPDMTMPAPQPEPEEPRRYGY